MTKNQLSQDLEWNRNQLNSYCHWRTKTAHKAVCGYIQSLLKHDNHQKKASSVP